MNRVVVAAGGGLLVAWGSAIAQAAEEPGPEPEGSAVVASGPPEEVIGGVAPAPGEDGEGGVAREVDGVTLEPLPGLEKGRSTSGQFVVYCDELQLRGAFSIFAEELKRDLLALIKQEDGWRYPIVIQVRTAPHRLAPSGPEDAVRCRIEQIEGGGFRFLVLVELSNQFTRAAFERELMRGLLAERMLRGLLTLPARRPERGPVLPPWLHEGVLEALAVRRSMQQSGLFASILESGQLLEIDELLAADPEGLDSVSKAVFRASAGALVMALLAQPTGADRFEWMIEQMPAFAGTAREMFARFFPGFRLSSHSLTKWWALEVARLSRPTVFDALGFQETDSALGVALRVTLPETPPGTSSANSPNDGTTAVAVASAAPSTTPTEPGAAQAEDPETDRGGWWRRLFRRNPKPGTPGDPEAPAGGDAGSDVDDGPDPVADSASTVPAEWWALLELDEPTRRAVLRTNQLALASLEQRGHPLFHPLVREYRQLLEELAEGKSGRLVDQVGRLEVQRSELVARLRRIEDYLDWCEATQRDHASGAFDAYFETLRRFESSPGRSRRDAISRYLDSLEEELR